MRISADRWTDDEVLQPTRNSRLSLRAIDAAQLGRYLYTEPPAVRDANNKSCLLAGVTMTLITTLFPNQAARLLECSAVGICEIDGDGRCQYLNPAWAQLLGYEVQELVGAALHKVIHPDGKASVPVECSICQTLENARTLVVGEPGHWAHGLFLHKEGHTISMSYANRHVVTDGMPTVMVMSFHDDRQFVYLRNEIRERTVELEASERRKTEFIATLAHELRNPLAPIRTALELMRKAGDDADSMRFVR